MTEAPSNPPKAFAFIPARYGSSRFPGKPLAPIQGLPMILHVYQRALSCPHVHDVFVATDDERIVKCVQGFGGKAIMTRKEHPSGTDRIAEAAGKVPVAEEDLIVNIQGDQPLFNPSVISTLITPFTADPALGMCTLKCRINDPAELANSNHVKVVTDKRGFALYFSRSSIPFFREPNDEEGHYKHLGIYAYRMSFLKIFVGLPLGELESAEKLEQLRALEHGYRIKVVETTLDSIEVDIPNDIEKVEAMMSASNIPSK